MSHAKTLFLIDDQKSEILVDNIFCQKPVCPDDNVDRAFPQFLHRLLIFFWCPQTGKHPHLDAVIAHSLHKGVVMLAGKDRRRHKDGHLLAIQNSLKGGADRNLRLSIADISADQAIHCLDTFHVFFRIFDRAQLVFRLLVWKHFFKFTLPYRIFFKCVPLLCLPFCIQIDKFLRDLLDGTFDTGFRLFPLRRIQFI